jgi:hypothetical protein
VTLDLPGMRHDLERWGIELVDGMRLLLYTEDADSDGKLDDLVMVSTIRYDGDEDRWIAEVDWNALIHVSDLAPEEAQRYRDKHSGV